MRKSAHFNVGLLVLKRWVSAFNGLDFFGDEGKEFADVAFDGEVGQLHHRLIALFVDRDDEFELMPAKCWMAPEMPAAI